MEARGQRNEGRVPSKGRTRRRRVWHASPFSVGRALSEANEHTVRYGTVRYLCVPKEKGDVENEKDLPSESPREQRFHWRVLYRTTRQPTLPRGREIGETLESKYEFLFRHSTHGTSRETVGIRSRFQETGFHRITGQCHPFSREFSPSRRHC